MEQKQQYIKKYLSAVSQSADAKLLVKKAANSSSHCLLLESDDAILLDVLTFIYIKALLNTTNTIYHERLLADNLPDIITLPRGEKFLTEDAEFIADTAYLTPIELDYKIYVIDRSDTMTESAQNKLLKLLEEPPPCCRFLLKCTSKLSLLPTVRSRSEIIEVRGLSKEAALAAYDEISQNQSDAGTAQTKPSATKKATASGEGTVNSSELRALIEATSFGRLDYIERLIADSSYLLIERAVFDVLFTLKRSSDMAGAAYQLLKFKDYIDTILFYFECVLHDCMLVSTNQASRIYFRHRQSQIQTLSNEYTAEVVLALTQSIQRARQRAKSYGNITAILDELLFSMLEVKTKWQKL